MAIPVVELPIDLSGIRKNAAFAAEAAGSDMHWYLEPLSLAGTRSGFRSSDLSLRE